MTYNNIAVEKNTGVTTQFFSFNEASTHTERNEILYVITWPRRDAWSNLNSMYVCLHLSLDKDKKSMDVIRKPARQSWLNGRDLNCVYKLGSPTRQSVTNLLSFDVVMGGTVFGSIGIELLVETTTHYGVDWPQAQISIYYDRWRLAISSFSLVRQFLFLSRGSPICSALFLKFNI
jgi:hypothetical protein